jgi:hypothetical protein
MARFVDRQGAAQVARRIALALSCGNSVTEYLPGNRDHAMRQVVRSPAFDSASSGKQFRGFDLRDGARAQVRNQVHLDPAQYVVGVARSPGSYPFAVPFQRYGRKAIRVAKFRIALVGLALLRWVNAFRQ